MSTSDYEEKSRMYDTVWVHKTKPQWIVFYPCEHSEKTPFYHVYEVIGKPKKYSQIWANDNKMISPKDGFGTLEQAMEI